MEMILLCTAFLFLVCCSGDGDDDDGGDENSTEVAELMDSGKTDLAEQDIDAALDTFAEAISKNSGSEPANYFYGMTRVACIWFGEGENGHPSLVKDILEPLGVDDFDPWEMDDEDLNDAADVSYVIPNAVTTPDGDDLQVWLRDEVLPQVEGAIANFEKVSTDFKEQWTLPVDQESVTSDYGDVIALKSLANLFTASIYLVLSYDMDSLDIQDIVANERTIEWFLDNYPKLLSLNSSATTNLASAKSAVSAAVTDMITAIEWLDQHRDRNYTPLFDIDEDVSSQELDEYVATLQAIKQSLNGSTSVPAAGDLKEDFETIQVNLKVVFDGLDIRSLLPPFDGNTPGELPDPTYGGIFPDGIPE